MKRGDVAIVTGGASGIGLATAQRLAREGWCVAVVDRADPEPAARAIAAAGGEAWGVRTDVADEGQVGAMVESVLSRAGRVDALVNAAGIGSPRPVTIDEATMAEWNALCGANLTGTFLCCRAVIPAMRRASRGLIVNVASELGLVGAPRNAMYGATKGAVIQLTRALAVDHAAHGIRVNCVCPGFVETDMWTTVSAELGALSGVVAEEFTRRRLATVPLGRMERPEDVANVIGFLASSKAGYMTGQAISVDGGLVMH